MSDKEWEGWNSPGDNNQLYVDVCSQAAVDDDVFAKFKSIEAYTNVLEHVSKDQGIWYLETILEMTNDLNANLEEFKENDKYGNPAILGDYPEIGVISPTTLRYIKNTFDMASLVGETPLSRIVEVGGGYGGLCRVLSKVCEFDEYIMIDLPEVSALQRKYIDQFPDIKDKVKCVSTNDFGQITDVDLFISNYALSECDLKSQMAYYDMIIANAKYVYLIYNLVNFNDFHYNDFIDKIKEHFTFDTGRDYENTVILATRKDESN